MSSQDSTDFNVVGVGTIGIGTSPDRPIVGAALTVNIQNPHLIDYIMVYQKVDI